MRWQAKEWPFPSPSLLALTFRSPWMPEKRNNQLLSWLQKSRRRSWVPLNSDGMPEGAKNSWRGNLKPQARKSCGGRYSSCSCSTFSFKSPYNQVEEKGQHLDLLPAGWCTSFTSFFSFWTAKGKWKWGCIAYFLINTVVNNCYFTLIFHCWTKTSCRIKTAWWLRLLQSRLWHRLKGHISCIMMHYDSIV